MSVRTMYVTDEARSHVTAREVPGVVVADTYLTRLRGMLARRPLPPGMLLVPGGSVHGVGMTTSLDVALLTPLGETGDKVTGPYLVVRTALLRPFALVGSARGVRATLEAPVGSFGRWGLVEGSVLTFSVAGPRPSRPDPQP